MTAKRLELPGGPPELAPPDRGDEVRQLVPEPREDLSEHYVLLRGIRPLPGERDALQDPARVEQRSDRRTWLELLQSPLAPEEELALGPVGEDEEHEAREPEVLEEEGRPEAPDEPGTIADERLVRVVLRDHAEVDVGVHVRLSTPTRAAEERGHDPVVLLACRDEPVQERLEIVRPRRRLVHAVELGRVSPRRR
ncbi:MAG TPA: hypothetical protein VF195_12000 [Actinomycetota bacterium]